jgi:hypothetical protein
MFQDRLVRWDVATLAGKIQVGIWREEPSSDVCGARATLGEMRLSVLSSSATAQFDDGLRAVRSWTGTAKWDGMFNKSGD